MRYFSIASGVLPRISMPSFLTFSWTSVLGNTSLMARVRTLTTAFGAPVIEKAGIPKHD